jgi:hypothetical protein
MLKTWNEFTNISTNKFVLNVSNKKHFFLLNCGYAYAVYTTHLYTYVFNFIGTVGGQIKLGHLKFNLSKSDH